MNTKKSLTPKERMEQAAQALREQEQKFNALLAQGVTGAPLVMSDQKLGRLEREFQAAYDAWKYGA